MNTTGVRPAAFARSTCSASCSLTAPAGAWEFASVKAVLLRVRL
jgi:hypothetical protein